MPDMDEDACSHASKHELSPCLQSSSLLHVFSSSPPPPWSGSTGGGSQPPAQGNCNIQYQKGGMKDVGLD